MPNFLLSLLGFSEKLVFGANHEHISIMVRLRRLLSRMALLSVAKTLIMILVGSVWLWHAGTLAYKIYHYEDSLSDYFAKYGMRLQHVSLEGHDICDIDAIIQNFGANIGDPILLVNLEELRAKLMAVDCIEDAVIARQFPSYINIKLKERDPFAIWQYHGNIDIIDKNGVGIRTIDVTNKKYHEFPIIVGDEEATKKSAEFLNMLKSQDGLYKNIDAIIYVGERRWDIRMKNGVVVKMPEESPSKAWEILSKLQKSNPAMLDSEIKIIDLRVKDKLYLERSDSPKIL